MWKRLILGALAIAAMAGATPAFAQLSDSALADRVAAKVRDYPQFTIFDDVGIRVTDRGVTLTGCVTQPFKRSEIEARVAKIEGVRTLTNEIRVLPVSQVDADIRIKVAQAIYGHPSFWHYASMASPPIHIIVEGGQVRLTGRISSEVERTLAFALAQGAAPFSVKNDLQVGR